MHIKVLVVLVVSCFQLDLDQLRFGVLQQQIVDFLGADFLSGGCCGNVDAWSFIAATAQKGNALKVDAASMCAKHSLLDLCAINACKWKQSTAYIVEHLHGIAVERIDLVAQLDERHHWVWVNL